MNNFFVYDGGEGSTDFFATETEAKDAAEGAIDAYRDEAPEGWSDDAETVCWGRVVQRAKLCDHRPITPEDNIDSGCDEWCDCRLFNVDKSADESEKASAVNPDIGALLSAAETCAAWMDEWLCDDLCECSGAHSCGKTERAEELRQLYEAIKKVKSLKGAVVKITCHNCQSEFNDGEQDDICEKCGEEFGDCDGSCGDSECGNQHCQHCGHDCYSQHCPVCREPIPCPA